MKTCFVIMGFGKKKSLKHRRGIDLDFVYNHIIKPAFAETEYSVIRADEITENSLINRKMFLRLVTADLVVADITCLNANAMYELGVRHALRPYSTIIIKDNQTDFPFDIHDVSYIKYHLPFTEKNISSAIEHLTERIRAINNKLDSPFFASLSEVPPIDCNLLKKLENEINVTDDTSSKYCEEINGIEYAINQDDFELALLKIQKLLANCTENSELKTKKAFCMYKRDERDIDNLKDTLRYIYENNLNDIIDVDVLCIIGAIKKRLWLLTSVENYLTESIESYESAFYINKDFYPGSNYAYLLLEKANMQTSPEVRNELFYSAKAIYRSIVKTCQSLYTVDEWAAATLSTAFLVLGDEVKSLHYQNDVNLKADWKKTTHTNQYERVKELILSLRKNL